MVEISAVFVGIVGCVVSVGMVEIVVEIPPPPEVFCCEGVIPPPPEFDTGEDTVSPVEVG